MYTIIICSVKSTHSQVKHKLYIWFWPINSRHNYFSFTTCNIVDCYLQTSNCSYNKNTFQSKVDHLPIVYLVKLIYPVVLLLWPWPWSYDLDIWLWPRYSEDVSTRHKWSFYVRLLEIRAGTIQTDRQTDKTECITTATFAGDNKTVALITDTELVLPATSTLL